MTWTSFQQISADFGRRLVLSYNAMYYTLHQHRIQSQHRNGCYLNISEAPEVTRIKNDLNRFHKTPKKTSVSEYLYQ